MIQSPYNVVEENMILETQFICGHYFMSFNGNNLFKTSSHGMPVVYVLR